MGKHPVSTTLDINVNRELDEMCKGNCSKFQFIRDAIIEKMENIKHERKNGSKQKVERGHEIADGRDAGSKTERVETEDTDLPPFLRA